MTTQSFIPPVPVFEKDIAEAKEILGETSKELTDEQIRDQVACMKYLVESWMEEYERKIFDGKTLNEIIPGINNPLEEDEKV